MPEVIILVGLPASGKSTEAKKYSEVFKEYKILSTDALIENYASYVNKTYDEVFNNYIKTAENIFWDRLEQYLKDGKDIIIDRTNLSVKSRAKIISKVKYYSKILDDKYDCLDYYCISACVFNKPQKDVWEFRLNNRPGKNVPKNVLVAMDKSFEFPTYKEGFDDIMNETLF